MILLLALPAFVFFLVKATFLSELDESRLHESEIRDLLVKFSRPADKFPALALRLRDTEKELFDLESEMATETMEWEKTQKLLEESLEESLMQNSSSGPFGSLWSAWNPPNDSLNTIMDNQRMLEDEYKYRITRLDRRHVVAHQRKTRLQRKIEESKKASEMVKNLENDLSECIQEQLQLSQIEAPKETCTSQPSQTENSLQDGLEESSLQSKIERLVGNRDPFQDHLSGLKEEAEQIPRNGASSDELLFIYLVDALERLESGLKALEDGHSDDIKFLQRMLWYHSQYIADFDIDARLRDHSLQVMDEILARIEEKKTEMSHLRTAMYRREADLIDQISQLRTK